MKILYIRKWTLSETNTQSIITLRLNKRNIGNRGRVGNREDKEMGNVCGRKFLETSNKKKT